MTEYEPELGQMIFGNASGEFEISDSSYVAAALYALSETLAKMSPDEQVHGFLGGEFGYGQDFKNDVFEMFPYYWGDCTCGYDTAEWDWSEANPHTDSCFSTRFREQEEAISHVPFDKRHEAMIGWAKQNGYANAPYGMAVYCDCGVNDAWQKWASENHHDPSCPEVRPNFKCGPVEVRWYKYIGRGMSCNQDLSHAEWAAIFAECNASLK